MAQEAIKNEQQKLKKRKVILPIAIVIAILAGGYLISESRFQSTDDAYVEADIIQVTPKVSGHIIESYIKDNMEVKKGDIVAKIDDEIYKEKYTSKTGCLKPWKHPEYFWLYLIIFPRIR